MDTEALDEEFVDQVELTIITITPTLSLQKNTFHVYYYCFSLMIYADKTFQTRSFKDSTFVFVISYYGKHRN